MKEILLGEEAEGLEILTYIYRERKLLATPQVLEEIGPALKRVVAKALREGKRREVGSSYTRSKKN